MMSIKELLVILLVVLVLFGGKRLPELGRGLGRGLNNFRKALSDREDPEAKDSASPKDDDRKA
jgi:sec-independent protein translocase protein TatA